MKQYFTGFITAAVFTSSLFLFIGAKKRTIDNLTVQKISIVDNWGNQVGEIGSKRNDSYLWLKSQKSRKHVTFSKMLKYWESFEPLFDSRVKKISPLHIFYGYFMMLKCFPHIFLHIDRRKFVQKPIDRS